MATLAPSPIAEKCKVRDELILAYLLAVNRFNEDRSRMELSPTPEFKEEARVVLEKSLCKCKKLQRLVMMHCLNHKC